MSIEYQKGKLNVVADALSRRPDYVGLYNLGTTLVLCPMLDQLVTVARDDAAYQLLVETCRAGKLPGHEVTGDGLLCELKGSARRVVVPDCADLRKTLLFDSHDAPAAGHRGYAKTLARLSASYVWKGMAAEVQKYCSACPVCIAQKGTTQLPIGKLQPLPIPSQKWADISLDFIVSLPLSSGGHDTCLVVTDRLTKMVVCVATHSTATAPEIARLFLGSVFRHYGLPHSIVSDRDPKFLSKFWTSLFQLLHTRLCFSSAYHPQTDGATERTNRSLEHVMRCHAVARDPPLWEERLPLVEFALNSAVHASTGISPFKLMYGYQPRDPLALLQHGAVHMPVESTRDMLQHLHDDLLAAQRSVAAAQQLQARYADRHRRAHVFHVGDRVMLSTTNLSAYQKVCKKLRARWCGPFTVAQVINPVAVRLQLPAKIKIHPVVHAEWLKPLPDHAPSDAFELPESDSDEELMPVSTISCVLKSEKRRGHLWYLVQWTDLPAWDCTWHTRKQLLAMDPDAAAQLAAFAARVGTSLEGGDGCKE